MMIEETKEFRKRENTSLGTNAQTAFIEALAVWAAALTCWNHRFLHVDFVVSRVLVLRNLKANIYKEKPRTLEELKTAIWNQMKNLKKKYGENLMQIFENSSKVVCLKIWEIQFLAHIVWVVKWHNLFYLYCTFISCQ